MLAALGQAPVSLPWATLAGLVIAFVLFVRTDAPRAAAWVGWAFSAGYFAASLFWIVEPFFVDPLRHGWMAPFALAAMAGGLGLFWAAAGWLARWLAGSGWSGALAWAVCLALAELARSYVLTGFPWALIGHVWIDWGPMQLAAWVGPHGLTLLTLLAAALPVAAWGKRRALVPLVVAPFVALYAFGVWQADRFIPEPGQIRPVLRLVQPNAPQHLKWHPDHALTFFERMESYTAAASTPRPNLIIWPETSVPTILNHAESALDRIAAAADGVPVVFGIQRLEGARFHNSLIVLDRAGEVAEIYDKHHLVPFGEYVPAGDLAARVGITAFAAQQGYGYSPGSGTRLIDLGRLGLALPLICYEAIFPQDVAAAPERPDWLMQITNDAWFGQVAGPYQHLAQARLRAVEQGLPMVRVANTGVSAVIDARGAIEAQLGLGEAGYLDEGLPPALPPTLYARTGDRGAAIVLLLLLLGLLSLRWRKPIDGSLPRA
ncbi:MAG: apolipoprotein N-acyltransferase [Rhodobacteraceae bacterium]|nr:apolipoprotein N-acyltransferase [Paracoccaceae bacterium]